MLQDTGGNVQLSMRRWWRLTGESSKRTRRRGGVVRPARVELRRPHEDPDCRAYPFTTTAVREIVGDKGGAGKGEASPRTHQS